jgi:acyl-coenzyme A thioesterase PaaI-like protein
MISEIEEHQDGRSVLADYDRMETSVTCEALLADLRELEHNNATLDVTFAENHIALLQILHGSAQ